MPNATYHFVYLRPDVLDARWSHLHRFIHPGSRNESGWLSVLGANLDIGHHVFASLRAKDWTGKGSKTILLRYELIDSMLEVGSHQAVIGFVHPDEFTEESSSGAA